AFTAADIQLASSIEFTMNVIKVLPHRTAFADYLERIGERSALTRARRLDAELAATVPALQKLMPQLNCSRCFMFAPTDSHILMNAVQPPPFQERSTSPRAAFFGPLFAPFNKSWKILELRSQSA